MIAIDTIWYDKTLTTEKIEILQPYTLGHHLGFEWVQLGPDFLQMKMPVDERTKQPFGLLHGGASCALAETLGSIGAYLTLDPQKYSAVGLEINANHVKAVTDGYVTGTARPMHQGKSTQVWEVLIRNDREQLVCISRITMAIIPASNKQ